jgi:hypothetical protein
MSEVTLLLEPLCLCALAATGRDGGEEITLHIQPSGASYDSLSAESSPADAKTTLMRTKHCMMDSLDQDRFTCHMNPLMVAKSASITGLTAGADGNCDAVLH